MIVLRIQSNIPGRIRWRVAALTGKPQLAEETVQRISSCPGVESASANPLTGSVLVTYSASLTLPEMESYLKCAIEEARSLPQQTSSVAGPGAVAITQSPFSRLMQHTRQHQDLAILATGVAFADRLFEAGPPALLGMSVDVVARGPRSFIGKLGFRTVGASLTVLGLVAAVVWTLDSVMGYLHTRTTAKLGLAIQRDLRNEVYQKLQSMDLTTLERRQVGEWMSVLDNDVNRVANFIEHCIDPIVTIIANGLIVFSTLGIFSPALAAVHLVSVPVLYLVSIWLLKPIRERQSIAREKESRLTALLYGNIAGVSTIASFSQQDRELQRVDAAARDYQAAAEDVYQIGSLYVPALQMVVGVDFITILVWGGLMAVRGDLPLGAQNTMGFSSLKLLAALGRMGVTIEQYQKTKVSVGRILRVLEEPVKIAGGTGLIPAGNAPREIIFDDVSFSYEPDNPVLRGLSLTFPAGKTVGMVGTTGAGKSTVLKLLLRFYDIGSGSIRVDGADIRDLNVDSLRRAIAIVPQQIFLFAGTVRENIAYAKPDASMAEVEAAARVADAHDFIQKLPQGYDTWIGERGTRLSGGQRQRVAIARAIMADRSILLFDEATSAVDNETEASIQRSLRTATAGRTTVIVAHRLSTIRNADLIYVLDEGRICEQGRHDDLIAAGGIYASLWRVQTGEAGLLPAAGPSRKPPSAS